MAGYVDALPLYYNLYTPAMTKNWCIPVFNGRSDAKKFMYVTFLSFWLSHGWMKTSVCSFGHS